jgi:hypothetical protein
MCRAWGAASHEALASFVFYLGTFPLFDSVVAALGSLSGRRPGCTGFKLERLGRWLNDFDDADRNSTEGRDTLWFYPGTTPFCVSWC